MYDHTLHRGRKHFCRYCLHDFNAEKIVKDHVKEFFKINDKQSIIMPKKDNYVKFKNYEKKSKFIIYGLCRF